MCTINDRQQVGVPECPSAASFEHTQGRKSVAFYRRHCKDTAVSGCNCCGSYGRSSYCNSHCRSTVKPIEPIEVTIHSTGSCSNSNSSSTTESPTSSQKFSTVFEWSLMTTMGWTTATRLHHQLPRVRVRWTSHRKLRRCKGRTTKSEYALDHGIEYDVNYKYHTPPIRDCNRLEDHHETNSVHIFKQQDQNIEQKNLRTSSDTSHAMDLDNRPNPMGPKIIKLKRPKFKTLHNKRFLIDSPSIVSIGITLFVLCFLNEFQPQSRLPDFLGGRNNNGLPRGLFSFLKAEASLIIGDSAIEIQEIDSADNNHNNNNNNNNNNIINNDNNLVSNNDHINHGAMQPQREQPNELIFGSTGGIVGTIENQMNQAVDSMQSRELSKRPSSIHMPGPLPPIAGGKGSEDITDGDKQSRNNHDYDIHELQPAEDQRQAEKDALKEVFSIRPEQSAEDKAIAGKVVDFELTPAGGHNKAKIKKKKKQKKEEEMFKKWKKGHKSEKKAEEKKHKEMMKKKKEEGLKKKKKWGKEEQGLKKKGDFKKKKWGKKSKKGKGEKKGKQGKKFLKDKGHKQTGFKTVYHKEEWGKSSKWHDIKRQKKWDEKSKKWKKKWKKEKGKKYDGSHMKKFEKKKKSGKKYKKESKDKFKKFKKEEFEKGKKKKMEEKSKKKEGGAKKMMKESKKKKKKS